MFDLILHYFLSLSLRCAVSMGLEPISYVAVYMLYIKRETEEYNSGNPSNCWNNIYLRTERILDFIMYRRVWLNNYEASHFSEENVTKACCTLYSHQTSATCNVKWLYMAVTLLN